MISERIAIRRFDAVWQNLFPLLTPYFMRVFNASQVGAMDSDPLFGGWIVGSVSRKTDFPDFISELAVQLASAAHERDISVLTLNEYDEVTNDAWATSQAVVDRYEGISDRRGFPRSTSAFVEALSIARNIEAAAQALPGAVQYSPLLQGAGIIGRCQADLSVGCNLIEIKAVERRFAAKDLKQLFVYLALDAKDKRRWQKGSILNPRRATWCQFDVDKLVHRLSGGRSSPEVFSELIDGMCRDVEIDTRF